MVLGEQIPTTEYGMGQGDRDTRGVDFMGRITTVIEDPEITMECVMHRLENGTYTWTTRTAVTTTGDIEEAAEMLADLAVRADDFARQELVRRLSKDILLVSDPEVLTKWRTLEGHLVDLGLKQEPLREQTG